MVNLLSHEFVILVLVETADPISVLTRVQAHLIALAWAHCCLKGDMRDALYNVGLNQSSGITQQVVNDLARFIPRALGGYTKDAPTDCTVLAACNLIDYLKQDLQHDLVELVVEDSDYDMTATFEMASKLRNDYSNMELFWSVDRLRMAESCPWRQAAFDPKLTFRWVNFCHLVNGIFKDFAIRAKIFMHFSETTSGGSSIM